MEHIIPHEAAQVGTMKIAQHQDRGPRADLIAQVHRPTRRVTQRHVHRHLVARLLIEAEGGQVGCGPRSQRQRQAKQQRDDTAHSWLAARRRGPIRNALRSDAPHRFIDRDVNDAMALIHPPHAVQA